MDERRSTPVAGGLLALSVALGVAGTVLVLRIAGAAPTADLDPPRDSTLQALAFLWVQLSFTGVGALVAARRPGNVIGWLLLANGLLWQLFAVAGHTVILSIVSGDAGSVRPAAAWLHEVIWIGPVTIVAWLLLVFPTGLTPSPRWRVVLAMAAGGAALLLVGVGLAPGPLPGPSGLTNPLGLAVLGPVAPGLTVAGNRAITVATLVGLASLARRYRRADASTRQQLKWLALAMAVVVVGAVLANLVELFGSTWGASALRTLPLPLIALATGAAVLKYRLFDIDLVLNKLVVYAGLVAFVGALYVAVVVGVGALVTSAGEPHLALSVTATAAAAVLFDPVRRLLQRASGVVVYGRRASPYEALASVTRRVAGGYATTDALEHVARSIAEAAGGTAEVWLTEGDKLQRAAWWPPEVPRIAAAGNGAPVPVGDNLALDGRSATFSVRRGGEVLGALTVTKPAGEALRPAEHRLVADLADSAALLLENVRLVDELRASRQRLVAAQDDERRRVERDLHDGAQQRLLEVLLILRRAKRSATLDGAAATLDEASRGLQEALAELRDLARGIHPAILTEQGLVAAVESLADRTAADVELDLAVGRRLDPTIESTVYFLTSEAIANVVKHAGPATARVTLRLGPGGLLVEVADDGRGGADAAGSGLSGLADRVLALDGRFEVTSEPGQGTTVRAVFPCA